MLHANYQRNRSGGSGEEVVCMFLSYMCMATLLNFKSLLF